MALPYLNIVRYFNIVPCLNKVFNFFGYNLVEMMPEVVTEKSTHLKDEDNKSTPVIKDEKANVVSVQKETVSRVEEENVEKFKKSVSFLLRTPSKHSCEIDKDFMLVRKSEWEKKCALANTTSQVKESISAYKVENKEQAQKFKAAKSNKQKDQKKIAVLEKEQVNNNHRKTENKELQDQLDKLKEENKTLRSKLKEEVNVFAFKLCI